jgi:hypothetical protein
MCFHGFCFQKSKIKALLALVESIVIVHDPVSYLDYGSGQEYISVNSIYFKVIYFLNFLK